jgi:hypothetical protein
MSTEKVVSILLQVIREDYIFCYHSYDLLAGSNQSLNIMKKILLCVLLVPFVISCSDNDITKLQSEKSTSLQHPVSPDNTIRISDAERQKSAARALTSYDPEELYIAHGYQVKAIDYNSGTGYTYYHDNAPFVAMASTNGYIFGVAYGELWRSNPTTDASLTPFGPYGTGWGGTEAMTALNGYVYAIQGGTLWRVNASNGSVEAFSTYPNGWEGTEAMTATNSFIYIIQNGILWRVNAGNGSIVPFSAYPNGWEGTEAMAAINSYVYAVQNGTLWRINTGNGAVEPYSAYPNSWAGTQGMAAKDGHLFAIKNGTLYKVNLSNGSVSQLGTMNYSSFFAMTARL